MGYRIKSRFIYKQVGQRLKQLRNQKGNKTIVFRPFQNQLYAASVGHHRSPEGVFQVRGHFRRYQTGKVIWIDGFMKGVDKVDD